MANNSGPPPLFVTDVVLDYQVGTHNKVTLTYNRFKKNISFVNNNVLFRTLVEIQSVFVVYEINTSQSS